MSIWLEGLKQELHGRIAENKDIAHMPELIKHIETLESFVTDVDHMINHPTGHEHHVLMDIMDKVDKVMPLIK